MNHFLEVPQKSNILRFGIFIFVAIMFVGFMMLVSFAFQNGDNTFWGEAGFVVLVIAMYVISLKIFNKTKLYSECNTLISKTFQCVDHVLKIIVIAAVTLYVIFGFYNEPGSVFISIIFYRIVHQIVSPLVLSILILAIFSLEILVAKRTPRNKSFLLIWSILFAAAAIVLPVVNSNLGL